MSRTTVYLTGRDGDVHEGRCFQNSWGSAWFIWDALCRTYLPGGRDSLYEMVQDPAKLVTLWQLDRDERLTVDERIALVTTFDYVMIRRRECRRVAAVFDAFAATHERRTTGVCTLTLQAGYLREIASHPDVFDVCWQQTNIEHCLWDIEGRPYNVRTDHLHWYLFDRYPELLHQRTQSSPTA